MEWDEKEANTSDVIDERGAGGGGGGLGDGGLGGLGSVLGGGGSGGGLGGLGGVLGSILAGGGGGGRRKGGCAGGVMGLVLIVLAAVVLPKMLSGSGFDVSNSGLNLPSLNPGQLPSSGNATDASLPASQDPNPQLTQFVNVIITDTNNVWQNEFEKAGKQYDRTKLVLFSNGVNTGCGQASAAMGPFYCPADKLVYIDLSFFNELATRFGASGDFAQAYVIAHEVGHHVQDELGITEQVRKLEQDDPSSANGADGLSVRTELQADCLAGVWAHSRYERGQADPTKRLDDGDIDEALKAASGVGDDAIQEAATGSINPDSFTHGSSAQRKRWFTKGYDSGDSDKCDTFSADTL